MYPAGLARNTTPNLRKEVSLGDFHYQSIYNRLLDFADVGEGRAPNDKRAIACIILFIFDIAVHWSTKTKPVSAARSTDSKVRNLYLATKMVQWLRPILQIFDSNSPMLQLPSIRIFNLQLILL